MLHSCSATCTCCHSVMMKRPQSEAESHLLEALSRLALKTFFILSDDCAIVSLKMMTYGFIRIHFIDK